MHLLGSYGFGKYIGLVLSGTDFLEVFPKLLVQFMLNFFKSIFEGHLGGSLG